MGNITSITYRLVQNYNLYNEKGLIAYLAALECLANCEKLNVARLNEIAGCNITPEFMRLYKNEVIYEDKITVPNDTKETDEQTITFCKSVPESKLENLLRAIVNDFNKKNTTFLAYALIGDGKTHTKMK
jgi:hypothetical protein